MYKQEVNKRTGDLCDLIRCLSLISESGILEFGDEDEHSLFTFNLMCSTSGLDSIREWIRDLSVSSDSAAESGINKMVQALGPGEIAGPPAFDISGDAASAGSRWKRWKKALQYYLLARGVNNPNQPKALLLHVAGMDVQYVFETLTDPGHPDEVDPDPHDIYERALRTLDSHFIPTVNMRLLSETCFIK